MGKPPPDWDNVKSTNPALTWTLFFCLCAFAVGLVTGMALATMRPASSPSPVLHGVGSRAFAPAPSQARPLQALPPTIAEPSHG